jgi:glutaminyl-peptide cyclotransferase
LVRTLLASIVLALISCNYGASAKPDTAVPLAKSVTAPVVAAAKQPAAAAANSAVPGAQAVALSMGFDPAKAWAHLHKQVSYGPRVPGSQSAKSCRAYLAQQLLATCDTVEQQEFSVKVGTKTLPMVNLIGRFKVAAPRRILLAAHWDSRPTADENPMGQRNQPILGANDGASGVAVLLELARVFHTTPPALGVDIVLFDGEDYGPGVDMMFLGARHFAARLTASQIAAYNYGILLDMIGDAQLDIRPESNSEAVAGDVYATALSLSDALGYRAFKQSGELAIEDDHLALIERGLRVYDFIDMNYDYWHTTQDTEDKCSKQSLEAVGRVVENMVYKFPDIYAPQ